MSKFISLLIAIFCIVQYPMQSAEPTQSNSATPTTDERPSSFPQFIPPAENEPVFPIHIEEPNKETNKFLTEFLNMLATLGFVLALILIIAWFLKRLMNARLEQMNENSAIKIVERRVLSPKTSLYILEVENKRILVAESHTTTTRLAEFNAPDEPNEKPTSQYPSAFSRILEGKDKI